MQGYTKKAKQEFGLTAFFVLLLILTVTHIALVSEGIKNALRLCANALIPTLFPFLILTDLILSVDNTEKLLAFISRPMSRILRLSPKGGIVFLLGSIFGFPMGAKAIARYYPEGQLSKEEAERLLLFSGNASPFFLIGSVGTGMLSSAAAGISLYLIQLLVSLGCGIVLGIFAPCSPIEHRPLPQDKRSFSLPRAVQGAVRQTLFISGYILFFSALLSIILSYFSHPFLAGLCASLLEISNACALASEANKLSLPFCAFSACFSGLCVYFQTLDCIEGIPLDTKRYIPVKLICGILGFFLALLLPFSH